MITAERRKQHLDLLAKNGLTAAQWLPLQRGTSGLRAPGEIAARLCALDAVFTWVVEDPAQLADQKIRDYAAAADLTAAMTDEERAIWETPRRAAASHRGAIGWRLENQWPLAWALGFDPQPSIDGEMIPSEVIRSMVREFLPKMAEGVASLIARAEPRSEAEVEALEDLFYCAHNAARSIQLGQAAAPEGWHPVASGGVIHERRHALTWCLSPGVAWDDVDLST